MKMAVCITVILVFFSPVVADDSGHDKAIAVEIVLLKGVMTRGASRRNIELGSDTKVLVRFSWNNEGYLQEPTYSLENSAVVDVRLKKVRLAERCQLDLEITAKSPGSTKLNFAACEHRTFLGFTVR